MWRNSILAAGLFACLIPAGTFAQESQKTVKVEVFLPEGARLFIEGQEMSSKGLMSAAWSIVPFPNWLGVSTCLLSISVPKVPLKERVYLVDGVLGRLFIRIGIPMGA